MKYYNNCIFFNVQKDFIIQSGDPTGTGKGGDSVFKCVPGSSCRSFSVCHVLARLLALRDWGALHSVALHTVLLGGGGPPFRRLIFVVTGFCLVTRPASLTTKSRRS